jgi:lactose PTS system EIICB component
MNAIINKIEKMKPAFEKISNNPYLRAIRDGFISVMPIILFSSIFLLVAFVPNIFGVYLSYGVVDSLMKAYSYSMGILGLLMSATIAKSLTDNFNGKLAKTNQINATSVMMASMIGFLLLGVDYVEGALSLMYMGSRGLMTSFVVAFTVPNIYKFCFKRNITIKMPPEVPGNISQTFKDLIPMALAVTFFWVFDIVFRATMNVGFSEWLIVLFQPLFSAADSYIGLAVIFGAMAFFWFIGIHGPSIVEPAVAAVYIMNVEANLHLSQQGEHASHVLAQGTQYFVATLGGTGATLVITFMFAFLAKSKQLKSIGKASSVPVLFGVNEPVLFGAPLVLNPMFFIPFILTPIVNVWIFRFFIVTLGMDGFIYNLPWTTPGPIGLIMGTGFATLAFILVPILLAVDFIIYYPFFKAYDKDLLLKEAAVNTGENSDDNEELEKSEKQEEKPQEKPQENIGKNIEKEVNVLVLCANGATSGMLANAILKGGKEQNIKIDATAMAYGQHKDVLEEFDIVVLAPQMAAMLEELQNEVKDIKTKAISTSGAEYVSFARNYNDAIKFIVKNLE